MDVVADGSLGFGRLSFRTLLIPELMVTNSFVESDEIVKIGKMEIRNGHCTAVAFENVRALIVSTAGYAQKDKIVFTLRPSLWSYIVFFIGVIQMVAAVIEMTYE